MQDAKLEEQRLYFNSGKKNTVVFFGVYLEHRTPHEAGVGESVDVVSACGRRSERRFHMWLWNVAPAVLWSDHRGLTEGETVDEESQSKNPEGHCGCLM